MLLRGSGEMFSRKLGMQVWSSVGEMGEVEVGFGELPVFKWCLKVITWTKYGVDSRDYRRNRRSNLGTLNVFWSGYRKRGVVQRDGEGAASKIVAKLRECGVSEERRLKEGRHDHQSLMLPRGHLQ